MLAEIPFPESSDAVKNWLDEDPNAGPISGRLVVPKTEEGEDRDSSSKEEEGDPPSNEEQEGS